MARRRSLIKTDRTTWAAVAGLGAWVMLGGKVGFAVGVFLAAVVAFPSLLHSLRPAGNQHADTRPAFAGLAAAAAALALLGIGHLTFVLVLAVLVALGVWLWPRWTKHAARTGRHRVPVSRTATRVGRPRIRGSHHGRVDVIEEVPTGRIGVARKKGGDGPTQVELCARANQQGSLIKTANRRFVHARWGIAQGPAACPLNTNKRHWRLTARGRAERTK